MAYAVEDFTFTWKIENFSCLPHQSGEKLTSAEFVVESIMKSKWCLWLYPRGYNTEGKEHISLFLCNLEKSPLTVYFRMLLQTTDSVLEVPPIWEGHEALPVSSNGIGKAKVILLSKLYKNKLIYLPRDVLTVKCWLSPTTENDQIPTCTQLSIVPGLFNKQCYTITRHEVHKKSLTWTIENIGELLKNGKKTSISLFGALNTTPSLTLTFRINESLNKECAQIEIIATDFPRVGKPLFVKCKIAIITADELYQNSIEDRHLFNSELNFASGTWIVSPFIKTENLTAGKYLYIEDTLVVQCDFSFPTPGTEYHVEVPQYTPWHLELKSPPKNTLCDSIGHYADRNFCDITLQAGGETFPAHRHVLCARSPFFNDMLQKDAKSKCITTIDIADVSANTLRRVLKFLYNDVVDEQLEFYEASNLYRAADKFKVDSLKQQHCSVLLLSWISVSTVCDIITLAYAYKDHFLMTVVYDFLHFHLDETLNSIEWKEFMDKDPRLFGYVMFTVLQSKPIL